MMRSPLPRMVCMPAKHCRRPVCFPAIRTGGSSTTMYPDGRSFRALTSTASSNENNNNNNNKPPNISKVLVANRGEIACRVIRTCQRFGIPTVALYSVADGPQALHAQMADQAVCIGHGPAPAESYLKQDDILQICREYKVQAVHPGYGFLSENASFAQLLAEAGHVFIGPPTPAIQAMGSKSESKAIMEAAGVPTTPGYYNTKDAHGTLQDAELLRGKALDIGYPVLIKAVSGGGGKGMRLVWSDAEFLAALESCQREANASFGDDRVLLEKYLVRPRHVEVQVVADTHGNVVSLHERDCSLQRRHQKIIEEAPASDLDPALREQLGAMGRKAAQAVGYVSAGTVEFLLDTQDPGKFYFCEMNTRLQVEHPITEEITGIDLVEWQLRVAAGEALPIQDSSDIPCRGHAFEARIYAENPARNFLPATGKVWHHAPPAPLNTGMSAESNRVRVDTCIQSGLDVSVYYDPMISKLIVHGDDRPQALQKLVTALKEYQIAGVPSNVDFLIKCAEHATFSRAGAINTGFLEDYADDVKVLESETPPPLAQAIGAFAAMMQLEKRRGGDTVANSALAKSPWSSHQGSWRMGGKSGRAVRTLQLENVADSQIKCTSNPDGSFEVQVNGDDQPYHVAGVFGMDTSMQVVVNGTHRIRVTTALKEDQNTIHVCMWPHKVPDYMWKVVLKHPYAPSTVDAMGGSVGEGSVKAPMPGKISRIEKQVGDTVAEGDVVVVMESMKMENSIRTTTSGIVSEIYFKQGDIAGDGAVLLTVRGEDEEAA